jgi:type II secretory pathway component PulC
MLMLEELFAPLFLTARGRQLGWAMLGLAGMLLIYTLVSMLFAWHADFVISQGQTAISSHAEDVASAETTLIAGLPAAHLFGMQADEDTDFLPITSLQLHLTGIIKDTEDNVSKVIISEAGQPGKIYSVGDALTTGIKIYSISEDGIVLEHGGRLEKLPLVRAKLQFQDKPKALWQDN